VGERKGSYSNRRKAIMTEWSSTSAIIQMTFEEPLDGWVEVDSQNISKSLFQPHCNMSLE
jgi:hypothetical protein